MLVYVIAWISSNMGYLGYTNYVTGAKNRKTWLTL
jgi:hypothetical protein